MADYHPLITRAVDGLSNNTAEARRILYERARAALVSQLRSIDPPLSETEITRERLVLEDVVCKVEAESVRKARSEPRPAGKSGRDLNEPRFAEALRKEAPAPHKPDEPFPSDASRFDQQASSRSLLLGARGSQRRREEFKGFRRATTAEAEVRDPSDLHKQRDSSAERLDDEEPSDLLEDATPTAHGLEQPYDFDDEQRIESGRPPVRRPLEPVYFLMIRRPP